MMKQANCWNFQARQRFSIGALKCIMAAHSVIQITITVLTNLTSDSPKPHPVERVIDIEAVASSFRLLFVIVN